MTIDPKATRVGPENYPPRTVNNNRVEAMFLFKGQVSLILPEGLNSDDVRDIKDWFDLIGRRLEREASRG